MRLVKITEQKRYIDLQCTPVVTESIERYKLKKKGKSSLRMRQAEKMDFIQGTIIDLRDERKANRKNEKRAKKRFY
jgi:hypothetical protein